MEIKRLTKNIHIWKYLGEEIKLIEYENDRLVS